MHCFIKYKNCYTSQKYITPDNWLQIQNLFIPSQILNLEKFAVARVHINQFDKISAIALFLLVIFVFMRFLSNISSLTYIIPPILKTSNITDNKRPISYFISCCLFTTSDLELVIPLTSKSAYSLSSIKPGFYLRSSIYPVVDSLDIDIFLNKRFLIIISSLASKNFTALLYQVLYTRSCYETFELYCLSCSIVLLFQLYQT